MGAVPQTEESHLKIVSPAAPLSGAQYVRVVPLTTKETEHVEQKISKPFLSSAILAKHFNEILTQKVFPALQEAINAGGRGRVMLSYVWKENSGKGDPLGSIARQENYSEEFADKLTMLLDAHWQDIERVDVLGNATQVKKSTEERKLMDKTIHASFNTEVSNKHIDLTTHQENTVYANKAGKPMVDGKLTISPLPGQ
jgi:hypothetical protein